VTSLKSKRKWHSQGAPWERQESESTAAWRGFVAYRDLGVVRSISAAAAELGKSSKLLERWSVEHHWVERAREWDNKCDRVKQKQSLKAIDEMRDRQLEIARLALKLAKIGLERHLKCVNEGAEKLAISPSAIVRLLESSAKIERTCLGEVRDMDVEPQPEGPGIDWSVFTVEELEQIRTLKAKGFRGRKFFI
jgi:hypothetical protein